MISPLAKMAPPVNMKNIVLTFLSSFILSRQFALATDDIKKVHIVYMNHLDVGYNGIPKTGFINNVLNAYFTEYFPRAVSLAKALEDGAYLETFIYTTHWWLVSLYTDCPSLNLTGIQLKCPSKSDLDAFTKAVQKGYITWHAGPTNMQIENMDRYMLNMSIQMGYDLDRKFGILRKFPVLSQRDVPGITQGAIPTLSQAGVRAISVGVNSGTAPPAVPRVFKWRYGNYEVYGTWHPGGYPDNPGQDPAHPGGLARDQCAVVPGFAEVLCFAFRTDNSGPPGNIQEVLNYYEILRVQFPGAQLTASTLEDYFLALNAAQPNLPVISQEMGDTWIMGVASDPIKAAQTRITADVLVSCLQSGECSMDDDKVFQAVRYWMKLPEHTWGLPAVSDNVNWTNIAFQNARLGKNYKDCVLAWQEQREFTNLIANSLKHHSVYDKLVNALTSLQPAEPDLSGFKPVDLSTTFGCGANTMFAFDATGALKNFVLQGIPVASGTNLFGQFLYQTFNEEDFNIFAKHYEFGTWNPGFSKNNITLYANPEHRIWPVTMNQLYQSLAIHIDFQWFGKTTTRLPEALYFAMWPPRTPDSKWMMSKVGYTVDPLNVMLNGSQYIHAVDEGLYYFHSTTGVGIKVSSPEVPIVSVMTESEREPRALAYPLVPITTNITGMAFNFYNNMWDTNYIFWYPYDSDGTNFRASFIVEPVQMQETWKNHYAERRKFDAPKSSDSVAKKAQGLKFEKYYNHWK